MNTFELTFNNFNELNINELVYINGGSLKQVMEIGGKVLVTAGIVVLGGAEIYSNPVSAFWVVPTAAWGIYETWK